jgi:hypothetical protein
MIFKDDNGYGDAVRRYREASAQAFVSPSKKLSRYERNAWLLHSKANTLIAIVNDDSVVFGGNLTGMLIQAAAAHR